ncbi:MAG: hypothetical protein HY696_00530 [Deltaproteobacteria bacterium]|nr:hypothetical protein [Deltaproteobacteria bacterium]
MRRLSWLICCAVVLVPWTAWTTTAASRTVPLGNPSYRQLDVLSAHRKIRTAIVAQRPYSRQEFARLILEAEAHLVDGAEVTPYVRATLDRLRQEFADEIAVRTGAAQPRWRWNPLGMVTAQLRQQQSLDRTVPQDNALGTLNAVANGFTSYQGGRHLVHGTNLAVELEQYLQGGRYLDCLVRPRFWVGHDRTIADTAASAVLQAANCHVVVGGVELEVGRNEVAWGMTDVGGILLSSHARPLDMIKLSSAHPFTHPWILRYLGPSRYTLFVANLGPENAFSHPFMIGFAANARPHRALEFGLFHTYLVGGQGAPAMQWYDPLTEFFFVRASGFRGQGSNAADHRAGLNLRWEVPKLRGTAVYVEGVFDDIGRTDVWANFTDVSGYLLGVHVPRLDAAGRWQLRLEYRDLPALFYRHGVFADGYTLNGRIIGDPLGPDGRSVRAVLNHEWNDAWFSQLQLWYERRDSNTYSQTIGSGGGPNQVVVATDLPSEQRYRAQLDVDYAYAARAKLHATAGYEYVRQFNFTPGDHRHQWMAGIGVEYRFGDWFR